MKREEGRRDRSEKLLDAMGQIDDGLVEEARRAGRRRSRAGKAAVGWGGALAACALLAVCAGLYQIRAPYQASPARDTAQPEAALEARQETGGRSGEETAADSVWEAAPDAAAAAAESPRAQQAVSDGKSARGIGEDAAAEEKSGQIVGPENGGSGEAPAALTEGLSSGAFSGAVLEADGDSVTFLLSNGTDGEVTYGPAYSLERLEDGAWQEVDPGAELAWEDLLYALSPGEEAEISVDLAAGYGTLPSGQYRLVKRYSVSGQEGEEELCLEFSVDGGEADAPQE